MNRTACLPGAFGPLPTLPSVRFGAVSARRGRRYAASAHGGAVFAALRLRCAARPEVAPHNSLRSLRSLRSNRCGESDDDARCARRPQACAAHRPTVSRRRIPPAAKAVGLGSHAGHHHCCGRGAYGQAPVRLWGAEERRACGPRAQRASCSDSSKLSERRERSERSEFFDEAARPSTAGQSVYPPTAAPARWRLPVRAFAAPKLAGAKQRVNVADAPLAHCYGVRALRGSAGHGPLR